MQSFIKKIQKRATQVGSGLVPPKKSPDELLGELFHDVQLGRVHADGMTFVDSIPLATRRKILKDYEKARLQPGFNLNKFVEQYFQGILDTAAAYESDPENTPEEHIEELWTVLTKEAPKNAGSLLALPHPYVVPGGRFKCQFYWDSYFIMLGLAASERWDLIEGMMKNYTYMILKIGYIPTANRTYFLSRSHPPFFSHMVRLLADKKGNRQLMKYLPYLLKEYQFWMAGKSRLGEYHPAHRRVVRMPDGSVLNRYFDDKRTPRPESYSEDVATAKEAHGIENSRVYLDLRAGAESGWDFSSRWLRDGKSMDSIHTTDIVPIDLNCLLLHLEETIAEAYTFLMQPLLAARFEKKAAKRAAALQTYCWNEDAGFYFDYDFVAHRQTPIYSLAAAFPLFTGAATQAQAEKVAKKLEEDFLKAGGLTSTLHDTGQQWDDPNGWAPLQWVAIEGLRRYGYHELADEVKKRWITVNLSVYKSSNKMIEKYDVSDPKGLGGGGEYPLQDGFGWTNGVLLRLLSEKK